MIHYFFSSMLALGLLTGCASSETKQEVPVSAAPNDIPQPKSMLHATIYVKKDGRIFMNQQLINLNGLEDTLKGYKRKDCVVFYSRENQLADPPETAIQVIDLIAKQGLPVQFYTDSTFTSIVDFK